jgi:hypothetical protein
MQTATRLNSSSGLGGSQTGHMDKAGERTARAARLTQRVGKQSDALGTFIDGWYYPGRYALELLCHTRGGAGVFI